MSNYSETLDFLYNRLPMFQRIGAMAYKKDLNNTIALAHKLNNPHQSFPTIHIAGTNGKGTVTHMIAAGLMAQGFKVGIYTSPHYRDFRERIKINGQMMDKKEVISFVRMMEETIDEIKPSFFEITFVMSLYYFRKEKVDFAVIETGLGGRLDSTNIIAPLLSVITNISFDHQMFLGNTLPEIAMEKAGIIKVKTSVLIGERQEETKEVFLSKSKEMDSPCYFAEDMIRVDEQWNIYHKKEVIVHSLKMDIDGPFIKKNLITSMAALVLLKQRGVDMDWSKLPFMFIQFSTHLMYLGRWHWLSRNPDVLCDSAHNAAGIEQTMKTIQSMGYKNIHFVLGFSDDKDLATIWPLLPVNGNYYFAKARVPRGMDASKLNLLAKQAGFSGKPYSSVRKALAAARKMSGVDDLVYIGGSIFVIAEVI